MSVTYDYPRPGFCADIVVASKTDDTPMSEEPKILLIKRNGEPYAGSWALPGGYVEPHETSQEAAIRELKEETNLDTNKKSMRKLGLYDTLGRDPRGWTISNCFYVCFTSPTSDVMPKVKLNSESRDFKWVTLTEARGMDLAFDHKKMINDSVPKLADVYSEDRVNACLDFLS